MDANDAAVAHATTGLAILLLAVFLCTTPALAVGLPNTEQTTNGPCTPTTTGGGNKIQVSCNDVDARALKRLNDMLDEEDLQLQQKIAEANEWARKYWNLDQQLTETRQTRAAQGENTGLLQRAQDLLHEGELEGAGKIFDQLIVRDEANIDLAAQDHFNRAQSYALQFRPLDALPHYALAYQHRPERVDYALEYANTRYDQRQYQQAEVVLNDVLPRVQALVVTDPAAYRPALAFVLNDLGNVDDAGRFDEAERAYNQAVSIERDLAAQNPTAYRPSLADTLNNLGAVYGNTQRFGEAESAFNEAVAIRRDLAAQKSCRLSSCAGPDPQQPGIRLSADGAPRPSEGCLRGGRGDPARPRRREPGRLPTRPGPDAQQPREPLSTDRTHFRSV
jgi:tetratricopeptide (TPR) repeat protein